MDLKGFNNNKEELYKEFNESTLLAYEVYVNTKFGEMHIRAEYMPKVQIAAIYSRLVYLGSKDILKAFKSETGYNIDLYNGKYNVESKDPEYIINELEEYLSNLNHLN
jgi:hypothetical protein